MRYRYFRCNECDLRFRTPVDFRGGPVYCPECRYLVAKIPNERRNDLPPPKRGMSPWLIVLLVILGLKLLVAALVGLVAILEQSSQTNQKYVKWVTFQTPENSAQVEMPSTPKKQAKAKDAILGSGDLYISERDDGQECFAFAYVDNTDNDETPKEQFDDRIQSFLAANKSLLLLSQKLIWNGKYPGCEVILKTSSGQRFIWRIHLVGDFVFVLVAIGDNFSSQSPDVARFFNSLKITTAPDFTTPCTEKPPPDK